MNASPWPDYPVLKYIYIYLRTYMVIIFLFCQVLREICGDRHSAFLVGVLSYVYGYISILKCKGKG